MRISAIKRSRIILVISLLIIGIIVIYGRLNPSMPQATIFLLNEIKTPVKDQKVLIFSPHPDDETIGCGGVIIESIKNNADVKIILVTDGNNKNLKDKRYQEFEKVTTLLGVKKDNLIFLDHADNDLKNIDSNILKSEFSKIIDDYQPNFIFYPFDRDSHPDHSVTGTIVENIIIDQDKPVESYEYLVHHNKFPNPKKYRPDLYLLPPVNLVRFDREWQRFMISDDTRDKKYQAILLYESQLKVPFLKSLILSSIRKNELFSITEKK